MKAQKPNEYFSNTVKTWFVLLATAGTITACQNSGGNNNNQPVPVAVYTGINTACATCGNFTPATLGNAIGTSPGLGVKPEIQISMSLSGDANIMAQTQSLYPASPLYNVYRGDLIMTGTAQISGGYIGSCSVPPGTYTIAPLNKGSFAYGQIAPSDMQASSPNFAFTFKLVDAGIYSWQGMHLYGNVVIQGQNGCTGQFYIN